jgi:hypothetical protein
MAGRNELLNLWIFGNQGWIRSLAINKPNQVLDTQRLNWGRHRRLEFSF